MILVTGGAGYVGAQLVEELIRDGYKVRVLDWFIYEDNPYSPEIDAVIEKIKGDIRNAETVKKALNGVDTIFHLAAISNDPSGDLNPHLTWEVNYHGTLQLLQLAKNAGVRRFINASTASVYGVQEADRVTEDCVLRPITVYAETKARAEDEVLACNSKEFTTVSVRPGTLVGYSRRLRLDLVANIFVCQAMTKGRILVMGGHQMRPLLAIEDMVSVYKMLLRANPNVVGRHTFNVNTDNFSVMKIAELVVNCVGEPVEIEVAPTNDSRSYRLYSGKITKILEWTPRRDIRTSIECLVQRFRQGDIENPHEKKYRNVDLMKELQLALY
ncbi:NAD(P)-dependent oxidoreductase [Geobacillus sp. C56-T3]|uniref:NAD-dependent epimerase/dehydratase family protein n=1 Tax=Geobacillus sp. (strain C56-T3) TaxID=691437 RepID=UPI0001D584AA|nr:SDR family oxidoreductase [Geobacillus sp. C56-T3]ADI27365.1 NAD-dependent epimerase/dehydratase [Geobacillus sp. C56-T3]